MSDVAITVGRFAFEPHDDSIRSERDVVWVEAPQSRDAIIETMLARFKQGE